jgi:hypothetical protein
MKPDPRARDELPRLKRQPLSKERRQRQTLNVDLGELKAEAIEVAKLQGSRSVGTWIKEQVAIALLEHRGNPVAVSTARMAANRRPEAAVVKFGGLLTAEQSEALRSAAAAEGMSQIEFVASVAEGGLGGSRVQAVAVLAELNMRLQRLEREMLALAQRMPDAAQVDRAVREVRAQARHAAQVLDEVSTTRRQAARRGGGG